MFLRVVAVITIVSAVSGLLNVILASRRRIQASMLNEALLEKRRRQRVIGWMVFWISTAAFLFLMIGHADPAAILLGLAIALAVVFPLAIIKGGLRLVSGEEATRPIAVARDTATGQKLGNIVGQLKEEKRGRIYKIRTTNGKVIEKPADTVTVELQ